MINRRAVPTRSSIAVVLSIASLACIQPAASLAKSPAIPRCSGLSVARMVRLLNVGRVLLSRVVAHGTSCTYYGGPVGLINNSEPSSLPPQQMYYVPAVQVSVTRAPLVLYYFQEDLLDQGAGKQGLSASGVPAQQKAGNEERIYYGVVSAAETPPCEPEILFDNYTGPPSCRSEPSLQKITTLAFLGGDRGQGLLATVTVSAQYPSRMSQRAVERLTKDAFAGRIA